MLLRFSIIIYVFISVIKAQNSTKLPHIIYIVADDLGWNDVGFHGSNQIPTPNIDALAYRGIILNNYYVQPLCTPSRSALMTGKYPIHTGMQHYVILNQEPRGLPLSERLLPQYLKDLGYSTHAVGKWHLGFYKKEYTPEYRGFDSHIGHWTGVLDYFDHSGTERGLWGLDLHRGLDNVWDAHGRYLTRFYNEEALKVIKAHSENLENDCEEACTKQNTKKPLFLYLCHTAVHSGNNYNPLPAPDETVDSFSYIKDYKRRRFAAILHWLDESVGSVIKVLSVYGMLENSIIVFTTDNGGAPEGLDENAASNWPLRGGKFTLWEGGTRGAAAIWSPLLKNKGRVSKNLMHISDWLPTLMSAVNGSAEGLANMDGFDSWNVLSENAPTKRTEALLNIDSITNEAALRVGDWKVVIGTALNGNWNNWYGPSGLEYEHRVDLILNSKASKAFDSIGHYLTEDQILSLRNGSQVSCEADESPEEGVDYDDGGLLGPPIPCDAVVKPCLFNINVDPCEKRNLAELYPTKLQEMLNILDKYNSTSIPPGNKGLDPNSNPALWDYTWTNYGDKEELS